MSGWAELGGRVGWEVGDWIRRLGGSGGLGWDRRFGLGWAAIWVGLKGVGDGVEAIMVGLWGEGGMQPLSHVVEIMVGGEGPGGCMEDNLW